MAQQSLHSIKASLSHSAPTPATRLSVGKKLGGHTARIADMNWTKRHSIPNKVMFSNKNSGWGLLLLGVWLDISLLVGTGK